MISPRRILAITRKEFLHILRDPWSLGMALAMPVLMLVLFGYALTLDVDRVPLVVYDQSQTPASRELASRFLGSRYFALAGTANDYHQLQAAIDKGRALAALVIPRDFSDRLNSHLTAEVQLIVDGSDSNTATIALGYAEAVARGYSQGILIERLPPQQATVPLDFRPRVWFNTDLESKNFIIPGLIAVIMMIIAALLTSLTVAREWEHGTMEQLISTPVRGPELIAGKLLPYWVIGMLDMTLAVLMGQYMFGVPLRGSVALLFGMAAIFLSGALSLGMLISIFSRGQLVASQIAILTTFIPSYLLSGFLFSIANMPKVIQVFTYLIPARYFIAILKGIYLKGVGLEVLGVQAVMLTLFMLVMGVIANAKFKKKLT